jgi:hypothetical protein
MMDNCDKHGPFSTFCRACDQETPAPEAAMANETAERPCGPCNGTGRVEVPAGGSHHVERYVSVRCQPCGGTGKVKDNAEITRLRGEVERWKAHASNMLTVASREVATREAAEAGSATLRERVKEAFNEGVWAAVTRARELSDCGGHFIAEEISLLTNQGEETPIDVRPRFYDSLRVVFARPDVREAIARALASQRGADWQNATEAGRNAFRAEAGTLVDSALA